MTTKLAQTGAIGSREPGSEMLTQQGFSFATTRSINSNYWEMTSIGGFHSHKSTCYTLLIVEYLHLG